MKLLFVPPEAVLCDVYSLSKKDARHLVKVLRFRCGDTLTVSDGSSLYRCEILCSDNLSVEIGRFRKCEEGFSSSFAELCLLHAFIKLPYFELALTKAAELGIAGYTPLITSRSDVKAAEGIRRKEERLRRKIEEASKQCGCTGCMVLEKPERLDELLRRYQAEGGERFGIFLDEREESHIMTVQPQLLSAEKVFVAIGPEGGFSDEEKQLFKDSGFKGVSLGEFLLRSETAVIVVAGMLKVMLSQRGAKR